MKISHQFDGGKIEIVSFESFDDIQLKIPSDNASDFSQWFYFRLQGAAYEACKIRFINAAHTTYPKGWEDYQVVCSYDRNSWFRIPSYYENGELIVEHTPLSGSVYYAYFEPYSYEQHLNLIGQVQGSGLCQVQSLGSSIQGREIDLLTIGHEVESDLKIWVIARQHPGETMAEWFVEGLLNRLLDAQDPTSRTLLDHATFYIIPNMNPDGSALGNLRTNAKGVNLNREWDNPSISDSPEVFFTRQKMQEIGVDLFLDIHGDENIPYIFVNGCEGIPSFDDFSQDREQAFKDQFLIASPDFQTEYGYPRRAPGSADLSWATTWVGENFKCLALTLEMPFKDNNNLPDDDYGWSGQRSLRLGESILSPILASLPFLDPSNRPE